MMWHGIRLPVWYMQAMYLDAATYLQQVPPGQCVTRKHSIVYTAGQTVRRTLLSKHRLRCSEPATGDWYTLMRSEQSPAGNGGDMIFCARIMSRNSSKLRTRHVNLPLRNHERVRLSGPFQASQTLVVLQALAVA